MNLKEYFENYLKRELSENNLRFVYIGKAKNFNSSNIMAKTQKNKATSDQTK